MLPEHSRSRLGIPSKLPGGCRHVNKRLPTPLNIRGWQVEWARLCDDLNELQELTLTVGNKKFLLRTPPVGHAGQAIQAAGVALGPAVRMI